MEKSNCVTGAERVPITPEICLKAFEKASNEEDRDGMERAIAMWMCNEDVVSTGVGGKQSINLEQRAKEIHSGLDEFSQSKRTTAVAIVKNADGTEQILVGSSVKRLSPAQRELLNSGEIEAIGEGHAEVTIINQAKANGQTVIDIAASRPICPNCANTINEVGANPVSPLKKVKR